VAVTLSFRAESKTKETAQRPQLVFKLDNWDTIIGVGTVKKFVRIGDEGLVIGDEWTIGGLSAWVNQLDAITLSGSSNTITQQMSQDQDGSSSVQSMQLSLNDIDGLITEIITPGVILEDILGQKGSLYLGYQDTAWPQDFVKVISGVIDEVSAGTTIVLNIAHPEAKKRGQILPKITTKLAQDLKWKSGKINYIYFQTRKYIIGDVYVAFVGGATAGSETVSVAGNNITIHIQAGVSTPDQAANALEKSADARGLVTFSVDSAINNTPTTEVCVAVALTVLSTDTTVYLESVAGLAVPDGNLLTYVRIGDEIIQYNGYNETLNTLTGVTRAALVSIDERADGDAHKLGDTVDSFYRIQGSPIDIALKALLGGSSYYGIDTAIRSIGYVEGQYIANTIYFDGVNVADAYSVTVGSTVNISSSEVPGNNGDHTIADIVITEYGSYIVVSSTLTDQLSTVAVCKFKSQYANNSYGLGMTGDEIDVPRFEEIRDIYSSQLFDYDFYITDTITVNDWLNTQVLYPSGMFTLPRLGKISAGIISPPLGVTETPVLDSSNTSNPANNRIVRSINRYFYNNIAYSFNEDLLDSGRMLNGDLITNATSKTRIPLGNKTKVIEARGVRPTADNLQVVELLRQKMLDRYKYGAERIQIRSFYGPTFSLDVGDVVLFGDATLNLPDTKNGSREFKPRLMEVQSKSLSISDGAVSLDLLDTLYSNDDGRYGIISPSSVVNDTLTNDKILITNSYGWDYPKQEKTKWTPYIGQRVMVHNEDWSISGETKLLGFDSGNANIMLVEALGFVPSSGYIVDVAQYPDSIDSNDQSLLKSVFVYTDPSVVVTSGVSSVSFNVNLSDANLFTSGCTVVIHLEDWSQYSPEVKVSSIVGTLITVASDIGFTPTSSHIVELIGFKDNGYPYRYV